MERGTENFALNCYEMNVESASTVLLDVCMYAVRVRIFVPRDTRTNFP